MDDRWTPVLDELRERFAADTDVVEVEAYLSSKGYDRAGRESSLRVQGPHERGRFTSEAWGFLVTLYASGAVHFNDFEQLDDGAMGSDRPLIH